MSEQQEEYKVNRYSSEPPEGGPDLDGPAVTLKEFTYDEKEGIEQ